MTEEPARGVSYQSLLGSGGPGGQPTSVWVRLGDGAISTRRKDARREISFSVSKAQSRWLREVGEISGSAVDQGAILRALVDLGMELEVDWALLASGKSLRQAVRDSVMVSRRSAH